MKELWQASQGAWIRTCERPDLEVPDHAAVVCYVGFFVSKSTVWRGTGKTKVHLQLSNKNIANSYVLQGGLFFVFGDSSLFFLADGIWLMDGMKCGWGVKSRVFCLFGVDKAHCLSLSLSLAPRKIVFFWESRDWTFESCLRIGEISRFNDFGFQ